VVCSAPLLDMVRYEAARAWVASGATSTARRRPEPLRWLLRTRPITGAPGALPIPAVLLHGVRLGLAGASACTPARGRRVQHATSSDRPVLMRLERERRTRRPLGHHGRRTASRRRWPSPPGHSVLHLPAGRAEPGLDAGPHRGINRAGSS
jgi:prolyl oligopeptidase